jgi:predicted Zn-dependent peptidase
VEIEMVSLRRSLIVLAVLLYAGPALAQKVDIPYEQFKLANGLRVIVHTDRKTPVVAVNVWYHVGSKDEPLGRSGFAHLFEHLMFQSSENHKGEFFDPFEKVGATNMNGTTNSDRTNYFANVPTSALDMALWMESDRMGHLLGAIDQAVLDEQRGVVQNEKRQGENQPYGRAFEMILAASYPANHPYHHTTIGSMADLNAATLDDVKNWFKSWYGPNNAVLVLAGDIDVATAKAKVTKYFGDIPASASVKKMPPKIAARTKSTREQTTDQVPQARVYRVWNIPGYGTQDGDRLALFAHVLGGARSSRLDRRLLHVDKSVDQISASAFTSQLGGIFFVQADIKQGVDPAKVEAAIDEELKKLLKTGPTKAELDGAKTYLKAGFIRGIERIGGFGGKSDVLARCATLTGNPACFRQTLKVLNGATAVSITTAAKKWLSRGDHVLLITQGERKPAVDPPAVKDLPPTKVAPADKRLKTVKTDVDRTKGVPTTETFPDLTFPPLKRATLSNGLKIVLAERPGLPIVQMDLDVRGAGFASDAPKTRGMASFTMQMMEEGAGDLDALAYGDKLESLGAQIEANATLDTATLYLSALKQNLDASLALYADVLTKPRFDDKELERVRATWLAGIKQEKARPQTLVRRLVRPLLFGDTHPYGAPPNGNGNEAAIAAIKRDHMTSWIASHLRPDAATLVVVGDTTLAEIQPKLEKALGAWKGPKSSLTVPTLTPVKLPAKVRVFLADQPGAIQANIVAAQVVPSTSDPSALEFEIANSVLGGEFSSRLNMNLREDKHWSYGSYSGVADAIGQRTWSASAAVQIDKTVDSIKEMQKEITGYATGKAPAKADEVAKIQAIEIRGTPGSYETSIAVLAGIEDIIRYGRADDWPTKRLARIKAMTPAKVNAATSTLKPASLTWVIVGDLSKIEAGIRALKLGEVKVLDADGKVIR